MRLATGLVLAGLCLGLTACAPAKPPVGRWEGTYESADTMIVARLQIEKDGTIYLAAPDAVAIHTSDPDDRALIRAHLAQDLDSGWPEVAPRRMDFDGQVFRKPGGIAPQMIWDQDSKRMTVVVYPGTQPEVRITMHSVTDFDRDPWPQ